MIKLVIIKFVGQTGLLKIGVVVNRNKKTAEHWITNGWAKRVKKPKKNVVKSDN